MKSWELFKEENEEIRERYDLSMERIRLMEKEETTAEPYRTYFRAMAEFVGMIGELTEEAASGRLERETWEELAAWNQRLYADVAGPAYKKSYANPDVAARKLGEAYGSILSYLYTELRGHIIYAFEQRLTDITVGNELLIELYNAFEEGEPDPEELRRMIYWWNSDYTHVFLTYRVREQLDPSLSFARDIICREDLADPRYLYLFGEYITDSELRTSAYLASLPQEQIDSMASTFTEGYRMGFAVAGGPPEEKKTTNLLPREGLFWVV